MNYEEIEVLLPGIIQRTILPGGPLDTLLRIMETLHAPVENILENLDNWFNPYQTPEPFVPYLARWVDLERLLTDTPEGYTHILPAFPGGTGRLRELIATAAFLSKWRGTARGLLHFLEIATGISGFTVEETLTDAQGHPRPFHIRVRAPAAARPHQTLLARIIEMEKPVYVTWELTFEED